MACVPVAAACWLVAGAEVWAREGEWIAKSVMLCVGIGLSVAGYLAVHAMLRSDELDVFVDMVKRKFGRSAKKAELS